MNKKNADRIISLAVIFGMICLFGVYLIDMNIFSILGIALLVVCIAGFLIAKKAGDQKTKPSGTVSAIESGDSVRQAKKLVDSTLPKAMKKQMRTLKSQTERLEKKQAMVDEALKNYFGESSISYDKFARTVMAVENLFLDNTVKIVNRINIFDEDGYKDVYSKHLEYTSAIDPYKEHFNYVDSRLEDNEMILQKMDKLLLEVNQLNDSQVPIEQMPIMQEINELIEQTKLYKQN
ncbi:MAG: hypothetical protein HUJ55_08975 [Ileibacterium sp.]|nr:hypothetical protein [Ileibacterium sp.]